MNIAVACFANRKKKQQKTKTNTDVQKYSIVKSAVHASTCFFIFIFIFYFFFFYFFFFIYFFFLLMLMVLVNSYGIVGTLPTGLLSKIRMS